MIFCMNEKNNGTYNDIPQEISNVFSNENFSIEVNHLRNSFRDYLLISLWRQVTQLCFADNDEADKNAFVDDMINFWFDSEIKRIENKVSAYNENLENGYFLKNFGVNEDDMPDTEDVRIAHIELLKYVKKNYLNSVKSQIM